jgi:hypothetical protein
MRAIFIGAMPMNSNFVCGVGLNKGWAGSRLELDKRFKQLLTIACLTQISPSL